MEKTKRTYSDINLFVQAANKWLKEHAGGNTKFHYALNRVLKSASEKLSEYTEKRQDLEVKYASEDKDGNVAKDDRGDYKYKKEAAAQLSEERRKLWNTEVEVGQYFATSIPKDLSFDYQIVFEGFVIKEVVEPTEQDEEKGLI